jgi:hypothetical protein
MHVNIQNAYELASKGDFKGSLRAVDAASKYATNGHNNRYLTPDEARVAKETAWQSHLNGRYIFGATEAYKQSKLPEYLKVLSEDRQGMTNEQYLAVGQAVNQQINFLQGLRSQEQNIQAVKFEEEIAQNPNIIPATRITELKSQVSPLQYEKLQLEYIKAKRKFNAEQAGSDLLINGFSNNEVFPRGTPEQKNKAFDTIVSNYIQNNPNLGRDEAEAQVAASAAGAVPGYVHVLNAKLGSANPVDIESAGKSIAYMYQRQKGANLEGLNDQSVAMYNMYQSLRRSKIPQEAAQEAYKAVYNQTPDEKKIVEDTWADQIRTIKNDHGKISYFTDLGGVDKSDLVDPLGYVEQAESMLHANFALTKGDLETAKTMTSEALKNTYGQSYVNGKKQTVFMPLENVIGIPHDGIGFIQDDVIESVNNQLASTKAAFDAGSLPYYWEVEPRHTVQSAKNPKHNLTGNFLAFSNPDITTAVNKQTQAETESGSEMRIFKHWKNGTRETFPLIIKADPWLSKANNQMKPYTAGWDIVLGTPNGYTPLYRENPMMGQFVVYKPDVQKIRSAYVNKNLVPSGGW